ncbi:hypothetical protein R3W88_009726 [Solanum pinnatisectum]|uniref:Uncharacterized protein n=1 Tax=Solanum pinnatisectum TaxID=50273 RepID=A0AAV9MEI6_9SOLN|nr:hypothetical protein R3W88_009726 [Solanum pinnatisectum]
MQETTIVHPIGRLGDERENSMINSASRLNSKKSSTKLVSTDDQFDDNGSFQKLESEKLVDDSTEFFTMMNKDYVGGPGSGNKPHHKPPINNFQPLHTSNP